MNGNIPIFIVGGSGAGRGEIGGLRADTQAEVHVAAAENRLRTPSFGVHWLVIFPSRKYLEVRTHALFPERKFDSLGLTAIMA